MITIFYPFEIAEDGSQNELLSSQTWIAKSIEEKRWAHKIIKRKNGK
jgi:hypothetical protein